MQKNSSIDGNPSRPAIQRILSLFLSKFFYLLYHQLAWTYDWVAAVVSLGSWQKWAACSLPYVEGPVVLEIGFGPGHLLSAMEHQNLTLHGLDESWQMVRLARKRLLHDGFCPNLVRGNASYLPYASHSFNQIVLTFPAEFILQPAALGEIHRLLVDGGCAVVIPMAWITGKSPLQKAAAWLNRITGEAPDFDESSLEPLRNFGFEVSWEIVDLSTSKVLVIKLQKNPLAAELGL